MSGTGKAGCGKRRLLVVRPGALGDTLLLAPALRAALHSRSVQTAAVIGTMPYARLLKLLVPGVAAVSYDQYNTGASAPDDPAAGADVLAFLGERPGDDPFIRKGARSVLWKRARPEPERIHAAEYLYRCIREVVPDAGRLSREPFRITPLPDPPTRPPYAVIAPGAGSAGKRLPLERFLEIAEGVERSGMKVLFVVGEAEVADGLTERLPENACKIVAPEVERLAGVIAGAARVYANDSGVGHLAGLLGVDTVSFFGPTDPEVWQPWGGNVRVERF